MRKMYNDISSIFSLSYLAWILGMAVETQPQTHAASSHIRSHQSRLYMADRVNLFDYMEWRF